MKICTWRRLIAVLVFVGLFLLLLPRLASRWHRDTVPDGQAPEPLQVNLATLRTELEATRESLPWATAYTLAKICNAAYEDWPDDEAERRGRDFFAWGFTKVSPVKNKKQYAYVLSNDDIVVVAFRGTDDWDDFKKDAWFLSKDWHQGHIHAGFLAALQDLEEDLVATVKTHGATSKRLWITGHSLGGAMAVAFGYDCLASLGLPPSGVVTFGQPRCFDRKLGDPVANDLHRKYVRFVHEHDIIPWLPPPIMPVLTAGYVHVGTRYQFLGEEIRFLDSTTIYAAPPDGAEATVADGEETISPEKYAEIERKIREAGEAKPLAAASSSSSSGAPIGTSLRWLATRIPEIHDHLMESYLSCLEKHSRQPDHPR